MPPDDADAGIADENEKARSTATPMNTATSAYGSRGAAWTRIPEAAGTAFGPYGARGLADGLAAGVPPRKVTTESLTWIPPTFALTSTNPDLPASSGGIGT